jgi:hypothetical protein
MEMLALFVGQASRAMGCQRDENWYWLAQKHSLSQARDRVYCIRLRQPAVKHCLVKNGEPAKQSCQRRQGKIKTMCTQPGLLSRLQSSNI